MRFKKRIDNTKRGYRILAKYCPGLVRAKVLQSIAQTIAPFVTIWFSARIINEMSNERKLSRLVLYVTLTIGINFILSMIKNVMEKKVNDKESGMWNYFSKVFSDKQMEMDFVNLEDPDIRKQKQKAEEQTQKELAAKPGMKVLIAGHSYILSDPYLGKPILDCLASSGAITLRADALESETARKACAKFSPTCRWIVSEEIVGGVLHWKEKADGIILVSAFPCGPDSMTNELLIRRLKGMPILPLVLDTQSGMAGVETRIESFLDIIRFQKGEMV